MKLINEYRQLNADEKQIVGGVIAFGLLFICLLWLASTTTPPILEAKRTEKTIKTPSKSYELPECYNSYAERIYKLTYEK